MICFVYAELYRLVIRSGPASKQTKCSSLRSHLCCLIDWRMLPGNCLLCSLSCFMKERTTVPVYWTLHFAKFETCGATVWSGVPLWTEMDGGMDGCLSLPLKYPKCQNYPAKPIMVLANLGNKKLNIDSCHAHPIRI